MATHSATETAKVSHDHKPVEGGPTPNPTLIDLSMPEAPNSSAPPPGVDSRPFVPMSFLSSMLGDPPPHGAADRATGATEAESVESVVSVESAVQKDELWLGVRILDSIPDMPLAFAKTGGSLLSAVLDGTLDVGVSGAKHSATIKVSNDDTRESRRVAIPLDVETFRRRHADGAVLVGDRTRALATLMVGAVTSSGAACEANAGFGVAPLVDALRGGASLITLHYDTWKAPVGAVAVSAASFHASEADALASERPLPFESVPEPDTPEALAAASAKFGEFVAESAMLRTVTTPPRTEETRTLRKQRVYPSLPGLHKSFTSAPTGHTTIEAITHAASGLTADQLEDILRVTTTVALENEEERARQMLADAAVPGLGASKWRDAAARSVQLIIRFGDYHVDGAQTLAPNGTVRFEAAENWQPGPMRDLLRESFDCDNVTTEAMRKARQIGLSPFADHRYGEDGAFRSFDPDYDPVRHPWTTAVRNALSHDYVLAFTIVGATTGEGTKATHDKQSDAKGAKKTTTAAGHAVPIFLPAGQLLRAMRRGDDADAAELQDDPSTSIAHRTAVDGLRHDCIFPPNKLKALPAAERPAYASAERLVEHHAAHGIAPMAIDGTVTSETALYLDDPAQRKAFRALAEQEGAAAKRLGAVMASRVVDLTSIGRDGGHGFYLHFVEATLPTAFGDDPALRKAGEASYQFVFAPTDAAGVATDGIAGASPEQVHKGEYALVPMQRLCVARGEAMDLVRRETARHALAPRKPATNASMVTETDARNAKLCMKHLQDLHEALQARGSTYGDNLPTGAFVELHVTPRMLWGNPNSVLRTVEKVGQLALHGQVAVHDLSAFGEGAAFVTIAFVA